MSAEDFADWAELLAVGPVSSDAFASAFGERRKPKTSAKKRRKVSVRELDKLMQHLAASKSRDDHLVAGMIGHGIALFLRPSEFLKARVEGTMVVVVNAKATNGRGNGVERSRDFSEYDARALANLDGLLRILAEKAKAEEPRKLIDRLGKRLTRACKKVGIKPITLYTIRHAGMATAKRWMTAREVAASAGHAAERTASSHYAKARSGLKGLKLGGLPTKESLSRVRSANTSRPAPDPDPLELELDPPDPDLFEPEPPPPGMSP